MAGEPAISPVLQALIKKGMFDRLPATFATYFLEQIQGWNLLFPAERAYQERSSRAWIRWRRLRSYSTGVRG